MRMDNGSTVLVHYLLHLMDGAWKIYDMQIEGISCVQSYRNQFNEEINAKGLDAVIARLQMETADIDAGKREPDKAGSSGG